MKKKLIVRGIKLFFRSIGIFVECWFIKKTTGGDTPIEKTMKYVLKLEKWMTDYIQWCDDRFERWWCYPKPYFRTKTALKELETMKEELEEEMKCC